MLPALEARSLNPWTAREVLIYASYINQHNELLEVDLLDQRVSTLARLIVIVKLLSSYLTVNGLI